MTVTFRPEIEKFIEEQVKAGHFHSATEVVEAGLARLMFEQSADELDEQDILDIEKSIESARAHGGIDAAEVHAYLRRKYVDQPSVTHAR